MIRKKRKDIMSEKALVVGVDGGTFKYLGPLMEQGKLPSFQKIADEGVRGDLTSSMPPVTATAWSNFITGKNPAKHRITDFLIRKGCLYEEAPTNSMDRRGRPFWEVLGDEGRKVVILNIPMTYPPAPVNGAIVSGFLSPSGKRDFVQPPELLDEIEGKFGPYKTFPHIALEVLSSQESARDFIDTLTEMLHYKVKVALYLIEKEKPDLVVLHIWGSDILQHRLWRVMDTGHLKHDAEFADGVGPKIVQYFQEIDDSIRQLREAFGTKEPVMIMSDHGFGEVRKALDLNAWLINEGYIQFKKTLGARFRYRLWKWGFTLGAIVDFLLNLTSILGRYFKFYMPPLERTMTTAWRKRTPLFLSLNDVDWSRTKAYSKIGIGQIVLNVKGREPEGIVEKGEEYDKLRDEIVEKLKGLKDPETGENVADRLPTKEGWSGGEFYEEVSDIFVPPSSNGYVARTPSNVLFSNKFAYDSPLREGHRVEGIFFASGSMIRKGELLGEAHIEDISPTLIHLMGHPVPDDMDGKVLAGIFTEAFMEANQVRFTEAVESEELQEAEMTDSEREEMLDRLRNLGYID